jgi:3-oxoacyl-[acyl-carrier-protein] synthase II
MMQSMGVCISGVGIISPLGAHVAANWQALEGGVRAPDSVIRDFVPSAYVKRRYLRPLDDVTLRSIAMAGAAMEDCGAVFADIDPARVGIVVGSMFAGVGCIFEFKQACNEARKDGYLGLSPLHFPGMAFNSLSGQPAIEFGHAGPNSVVTAGLASGAIAIAKGAELIRSGKADVVIAGGAEMSHPFVRQRFAALKDTPAVVALGAHFEPAEAVCLFVLHRQDDARFPQSRVYGMLDGWRYGFLPEGCQAAGVARIAGAMPGWSAQNVAAVVASAYEDSPLACVEDAAFAQMFAQCPPVILRNKSQFGHALGAAGSLDCFHGLLYAREKLAGRGAVLVSALDPGGCCAFLRLSSVGAAGERSNGF